MSAPTAPAATRPARVLAAAAAIAEAAGLGPEADFAVEWASVSEPVIRIRVNSTPPEGEARLDVVRRVADALGVDVALGDGIGWQPGLMVPTAHASASYLGLRVEVDADLEDTL